MHIIIRIWHLVIHVLVLVADSVMVVVVHVVENDVVIVLESSPVQVVRQVVESHVVDMGWVDLVVRQLLVPEVV